MCTWMYTGFHYSGNQSQDFGMTMTFYYVWKVPWCSWHLYRNTKPGNIYGILAMFLSLFFFFYLPEKAEKCQFLCNNSQVSQTPAACPAERLPWDLVGAGWDRRRISMPLTFLHQSVPLLCPCPEWLSPAIKKNHLWNLAWICLYTMYLKVRYQI